MGNFLRNDGDLRYPGSQYQGSPQRDRVQYFTPDSPAMAEQYYEKLLGEPMKSESEDFYYLPFTHNGLHGEVTVEGTYDGGTGSHITFNTNYQ